MKVLILSLTLLFYFISTKFVLNLLYRFVMKIFKSILALVTSNDKKRKNVYVFMLFTILYYSLYSVPLLNMYFFLFLLGRFYPLNCLESIITLCITGIYTTVVNIKMLNNINKELQEFIRKKINKKIVPV